MENQWKINGKSMENQWNVMENQWNIMDNRESWKIMESHRGLPFFWWTNFMMSHVWKSHSCSIYSHRFYSRDSKGAVADSWWTFEEKKSHDPRGVGPPRYGGLKSTNGCIYGIPQNASGVSWRPMHDVNNWLQYIPDGSFDNLQLVSKDCVSFITGLSTLYRWFWAMLHMCMQLYAHLHYKGLEFRPLFWKFNNMPKSMCRREPGECMMTATCRWKWYTCSATLRLFKTIMRTWIFKVTWLLDIFSINEIWTNSTKHSRRL
jgi:hypothetical protein